MLEGLVSRTFESKTSKTVIVDNLEKIKPDCIKIIRGHLKSYLRGEWEVSLEDYKCDFSATIWKFYLQRYCNAITERDDNIMQVIMDWCWEVEFEIIESI